MLKPSGHAIVILLAFTIFSGLVPFFESALVFWKLTGAGISGVLLLDFYLGLKLPDLAVQRGVRHSLPVGVWSKVILGLKNNDQSPLVLRVFDHYPKNCEVQGLPLNVILPAGKRIETVYRLRPKRKGPMRFGQIDFLILSPLKLWWKKTDVNKDETINVFPNFREIKKYSLLATDNRLSTLGIIKKQKRGEGNDFDQLRDYRSGDSFRQIDWNKTSRYLKLITKAYQDERDQQVLFLIDCGRRMRHVDSRASHFDQALNAMLLLAHVAVRQDDAVGFMTFGGVDKWFPPKKNANTIRHILHQVYDIHPTLEVADYLTAAKNVTSLQKRRALIIILTNTRDEDQDDLIAAMKILRKRHLVVLADLREKIIDAYLNHAVTDLDTAVLFNAVYRYLENRINIHKAMHHQGVLTLNIHADKLPAALVNQYLMVKSSGKL